MKKNLFERFRDGELGELQKTAEGFSEIIRLCNEDKLDELRELICSNAHFYIWG